MRTPSRLNAPCIHPKAHGSGSDSSSHTLPPWPRAGLAPHSARHRALLTQTSPRHTGLTHTRRIIDLCVHTPGWSITCGRNHPASQGDGTKVRGAWPWPKNICPGWPRFTRNGLPVSITGQDAFGNKRCCSDVIRLRSAPSELDRVAGSRRWILYC